MDILANPGPLKDIVLYDQEKHVSSAVWDGQERGALRCHEHTSKLGEWKLKPKQIELVERAGFGYLRRIPAISLDNPLISALVERWRRETNTFHFTTGEMTVTLEDIALLLGLGIDGKPVIGVTYTTCSAVCERYLGKVPESNYASGGMVKLSWLKDKFSDCKDDASFERVEYCTRAYLLYLVGSTIFSTTTGNKVPVMYLPLFEDFDDAGTFAWGAAALAFLYRALGNASVKSQSTICGCLTLLQCWSYYHLNVGRPKLNREPIHDHFPFVLRWKGKQTGPTANRDVVFYRKALDALKPCEVEWLPYENMDGRYIPDHIRNSLQLGRSKTMLISFDKAERHLPDRCLKQFALFQGIPEDVQKWVRKSRGVDGGVDLSVKMESELSEWEMRWENIVPDDVLGVDEADYMRWYLGITRKIVGRPISLSSEFQRTITNVRDILELAENFQTHDLDLERGNMISRIMNLAQDCLRDQAGVTVTAESQQQIELGKRMRGKERVRRKGMGKRRKGIDPMEDYGGSEDESQFGPVVEVGEMHLPLTHTNSVYDGTHLYDPVTKVDDMELCDTIRQLPETQDINKIDGSLLDDADKSFEDSKLHEEIDTTNVMSGEEPTESMAELPEGYDVKKEDKESKVEDYDAAKEIISDVSGEENANREEEDGTEMGESVADSSSLERRGANTMVA
ncbi:PREDICTED: serine/threonine-protein phosphatase 7 long form homolog isoform X1 [Camelina sativa]|uniref:Serine/threonine-protein phosphatase 7 long form homolog isoform X1 n=1 Tax=Camelina sativa TaxID=90675 RepID=A0ABM0W827_CAMSA|nr:PREDICTED: serine/threonine-protein phosphatase 7 long form homolog isoform X1 [Camelina sativa]XP_010467043.1 PREDICTED: serine/threonine-protein phosphatase 7 long form homolog isoform X1 [Camelina sativa]XP_010467044.1 PREDICTED: serine/threonine-protein phosphatase 7 long form homolog isoform X1 [Camelina sativa]